jgi:hypothetical protein
MKEETKDKVAKLEYYVVLGDFEDVFGEIQDFPPRRDIDFSIELIPRDSLVSKETYIMNTIEIKEP